MTTRGARIHNMGGAKIISTRSAGLLGPGVRGARWAGRVAAVALVTLVAACGGHVAYAGGEALPVQGEHRLYGDQGWSNVIETRVQLSDGRTVTCLATGVGQRSGGGLSCDWQEAR